MTTYTPPETLNVPQSIPELIAAWMEKHSLNYQQAADLLKLSSRQVVHRWHSGANEPQSDTVAKWFNDPRPAVSELATEIYVIWYRKALQKHKN